MTDAAFKKITENKDFMRALTRFEDDRGLDISTSNEEAVNQFLSEYRYLQANTYGAFQFVNYVESLNKPEDQEYKKNLGKIYKIIDEEVDEVFGENIDLEDRLGAVGEYVKYSVTDPINLLGLGVGKVVGAAVARPVLKGLINRSLKTLPGRVALGAAGAGAIEAPVSALQSYKVQQAEKELDLREDISLQDMAIDTGLGVATAGVFGGIGGIPDTLKKARQLEELSESFSSQGRAGKYNKVSDISQVDDDIDLLGVMVEVDNPESDLPTNILDDFDMMGRIVGVTEEEDLPKKIVVEFLSKDATTRQQIELDPDKLNPLTDRQATKNSIRYVKDTGGFYDQESVKRGAEYLTNILKEKNLETGEAVESFSLLANPNLIKQVNNALEDIALQDPDVKNNIDPRFRVTEKAAVIFQNTDSSFFPEEINKAVSKFNLTKDQFTDVLRADISQNAAVLGQQGKLDFDTILKIGQEGKLLTPADEIYIQGVKEAEDRAKKVGTRFNAAVDGWRSLLIVQPVTTFRNIVGSAALAPGDILRARLDNYFMEFENTLLGYEKKDLPKTLNTRDHLGLINRLSNPEGTIEIARMVSDRFTAVDQLIFQVFDDRVDFESEAGPIGLGMLKASKVLNILNSVQDRAIKSAGFLTELDYQIKQAANRGDIPPSVNSVESAIAQNQLNDVVSDAMISKSLEAAYRLTYQDRRAGDKVVFFGDFINRAQSALNNNPALKLAVPFPNFMVNSYVYFLNRIGGGLLKSGKSGLGLWRSATKKAGELPSDKRKELLRLNAEIESLNSASVKGLSAKQKEDLNNAKASRESLNREFFDDQKRLTDFKEGIVETVEGLSLFLLAYAMRSGAIGEPGEKYYEMFDQDGERRDYRPLFPLAPFMYLADAAYKHFNGLPQSELLAAEGLEAILGISSRAGLTGQVVQAVNNIIQASEGNDEANEKVGKFVGGAFGYFLGGVGTFMRPLQDIATTVGGQDQREFRDRKLYEDALLNLDIVSQEYSDNSRFLMPLFDETIKAIVVGTPLERVVFPDAPQASSAFQRDVPKTADLPITKQIPSGMSFPPGTAARPKKGPVEAELDRLGINKFKIQEYSGVPQYDAVYNQLLGELSEDIVLPYMQTEDYLRRSPQDKKAALELLYRSSRADDLPDAIKRAFTFTTDGGRERVFSSLKSIVSDKINNELPILVKFKNFRKRPGGKESIAEGIRIVEESLPSLGKIKLKYDNERGTPEQVENARDLDKMMTLIGQALKVRDDLNRNTRVVEVARQLFKGRNLSDLRAFK